MTNLELLIRYILLNYPKIEELSKPRLVKLIYLIDWKYAINTGHQFTDIKWIFNHYGPYVDDVIQLMKSSKQNFKVTSYANPYGGVTDKFVLVNKAEVNLDKEIKDIINFVIDKTVTLNWTEFINTIYSSYPIRKSLKYSILELDKLSVEFKTIKQLQSSASASL